MKTLIVAGVSIAVAFLLVGGCVATSALSIHWLADLQTKHYQSGDAIDPRFPLIVITPNPQTQQLDQLDLVRWHELQEFLKTHPVHSFRLPGSGEFSKVRYLVSNSESTAQTVEVQVYREDKYISRYQASDEAVTPLYYYALHRGLMLQAIPIGLGITCLLYYLAWRLANRRWQAIGPVGGSRKLWLGAVVSALVLSKTRWREQ